MNFNYKSSFISFMLLFVFSFAGKSQYCAPAVTTTGLYLSSVNFTVPNTGFTGGQVYNTGSNGYTQTTGSSSGTLDRYFGASIYYSIYNPTSSAKSFEFKIYADWNNDGDFNDTAEYISVNHDVVAAYTSSTTGMGIIAPLFAPAGNVRIRLVVSQNGVGTATPCGSFVGEVEDYLITLSTNNAPVLNTAATPFLNTILGSQTNSNGMSVSAFIGSAEPSAELITDGNDHGAEYYNKVPRGIAIYNQTATNGTWQYKIANGSWTNFGSVSNTNALVLLADAPYLTNEPGSRIRFVPTGVGTPTFSFRAWDGVMTSPFNGGYADISTIGTGGTTPFSTGTLTATLSVIASSAYSTNTYFSNYNNTIYSTLLNRVTGAMLNPEPLLTNNDTYYSLDLTVDPSGNKIYWQSGASNAAIASANNDGSNVQATVLSGLTYNTALTTDGTKLYYWNWADDYSATYLYQSNMDGTGITKISGAVGGLDETSMSDTKYITFYKNKLYLEYLDNSVGSYHIVSLNTDGTGLIDVYDTPSTLYGISAANDTLYWAEGDGINTSINKLAIAGGSATTIATETGSRIISNLIVDPATSFVYYSDGDPAGYYSLVRKVPSAGGIPLNIVAGDATVTSLSFANSESILPVSLFNLAGHYVPATYSGLLQWKTASEQQSAYFEVQRSLDSKEFTKVGTVAASGNSSIVQNYQFTDNLNGFAGGTTLYYRIKQVDENNQFRYYGIVPITINAAASASTVWPNPGTGKYVIATNQLANTPTSIAVYDVTGNLVLTDQFNKPQYNLDITAKPTGAYYIKLAFADGTQQQLLIIKN